MANINSTIQTFLDYLGLENILLVDRFGDVLTQNEITKLKQEFIIIYFPEEAA